MIYAILAITVITTAGGAFFAWLAYKERREILARHELRVSGLIAAHQQHIASLIQWVKDTPAASATVVADSLAESPAHVPVWADPDPDDELFKSLDGAGLTH